jgi:hypothetical protein
VSYQDPVYVRRATMRTVQIPAGVRILLQERMSPSGKMFRVRSVSEEYTEYAPKEENVQTIDYRVTVRGPMVTKSGADHATHRGETTWWAESAVDPAVLPYVAGVDMLRETSDENPLGYLAELGEQVRPLRPAKGTS